MNLLKIALFVVAACALALSQSPDLSAGLVPKPVIKLVECSEVGFSPACKSFNEMVAKGDRDIVTKLSTGRNAYVCFRESEDSFLIVEHDMPPDSAFEPASGIRKAPAGIFMTRYKQGMEDDGHIWWGHWTKFTDTAYFESVDKVSGASALVNASELDLSYSFKNISGSKTNYTIQIRQSTLRFIETFNFSLNTGTAAKPKLEPNQTQKTGYCKEFWLSQ